MTTTTATVAATPRCHSCGKTPTAPNFMSGWACWHCRSAMSEDRYPVIVEYTHRHVVWVEAPDQTTAVNQLQHEPYEVTNDQTTLFESGWSVKAPEDHWDWQDVYEGGYSFPYDGQRADAHVETHRQHLYQQARTELEAWTEHENREQAAGRLAEADRRTCPVCPAWLEPGHAETPYHVSSARMAANRARYEAERAAAVEPAPA